MCSTAAVPQRDRQETASEGPRGAETATEQKRRAQRVSAPNPILPEGPDCGRPGRPGDDRRIQGDLGLWDGRDGHGQDRAGCLHTPMYASRRVLLVLQDYRPFPSGISAFVTLVNTSPAAVPSLPPLPPSVLPLVQTPVAHVCIGSGRKYITPISPSSVSILSITLTLRLKPGHKARSHW